VCVHGGVVLHLEQRRRRRLEKQHAVCFIDPAAFFSQLNVPPFLASVVAAWWRFDRSVHGSGWKYHRARGSGPGGCCKQQPQQSPLNLPVNFATSLFKLVEPQQHMVFLHYESSCG